jgi:DNA-binding response OmpR family regulator
LLRHANQVVSRNEILENVWGPNFFGDGNVLDVYIRYLRQKIDLPGCNPLIHTHRGVGYMLRLDE